MATRYLKFPTYVSVGAFESHAINWLNQLLSEAGMKFREGQDVEQYLRQAEGSCQSYEIGFDLKDVSYIGLHEMLMVNLLGEFCRYISGKRISTTMPRSKRVREFLSTFGFFQFFYGWGTTTSLGHLEDLPDWKSGRLLQITRIESPEDVGEATTRLQASRIASILAKMLGTSDKVIRLRNTILSEICQNIPEHSRRNGKGVGYCAVQSHGNGKRERGIGLSNTIEIAIVDAGVGIKQSLTDRYPVPFEQKPPADCIEYILTNKLPPQSGRDRGGLLRVMRSICQDFGGRLRCRSISGTLIWKPNSRVIKKNFIPMFIGTQYRLLLPIEEYKE